MNSKSILSHTNITSILDNHFLEIPKKIAISWLANGDDVSEEITYEELIYSSKSIAANLMLLGCNCQIVALSIKDTPSFIKCFLGCLYAGVTALPLPPGFGEKGRLHVQQIIKSANPAWIISDCITEIKELKGALISSRVIEFKKLTSHIPYNAPAITGETTALVQYTSGSSTFPKGVIITHKNLIATQEMIRSSFDHKEGLIVASWLPLHHDMGLIGGLLQPLVLGGHAVLMPPFSFIKKPLRWLSMIDRYKVETSGAPNFAYDLCNKSIGPSDLKGLNLSSWKIAFCGSEPVRKDTLNKFSENLSSASFNPLSLIICYGLAEATLLVAATKPGQKIDIAKNLSSIKAGLTIYPESCEYIDCGFPAHGCEVSILNSETGQLAEENQIGEILIAGPNVASGYLLNEKRIDLEQKEISDITWCATGDLGFINLGRLFITGRKKNLIKVYGQNLHAEDIERKVSSLLPLINNNAVFPYIDGGKESMVLTLELPDANYKSGLAKINLVNLSREIGIFFGITPFDIIIVPKWGIPRTTSGKIQREKLQQLYVNSKIKYLDKLRQ